jgi:hypothetical protein
MERRRQTEFKKQSAVPRIWWIRMEDLPSIRDDIVGQSTSNQGLAGGEDEKRGSNKGDDDAGAEPVPGPVVAATAGARGFLPDHGTERPRRQLRVPVVAAPPDPVVRLPLLRLLLGQLSVVLVEGLMGHADGAARAGRESSGGVTGMGIDQDERLGLPGDIELSSAGETVNSSATRRI